MATTIFDVNFTKHESASMLRVLVFANLSSPDDIQFNGYIVLDEEIKQVCHANIVLDRTNSAGAMPLSPFAFLSGVPAGAHNIKFIIENTEVDNINLTVKTGATIEITEIKQAAL